MRNIRNIIITIFIISYLGAFHYESLRHFYLNPIFKKELPKIKFLFPPAGWIMFYKVGDSFGATDIYGVKNGQRQRLDLHDIFRVRTIGYDNIHRGIMGTVANKRHAKSFCHHLNKRFEYFDEFLVVLNYYPSFVKEPHKQEQYLQYKCVK
ncbi:MAG: hypothetical protein ACI9E5_001130 [Candidatus Omnitrophota bacterium]|jgi:hypothetical protein